MCTAVEDELGDLLGTIESRAEETKRLEGAAGGGASADAPRTPPGFDLGQPGSI
jgi:hypothetical protein